MRLILTHTPALIGNCIHYVQQMLVRKILKSVRLHALTPQPADAAPMYMRLLKKMMIRPKFFFILLLCVLLGVFKLHTNWNKITLQTEPSERSERKCYTNQNLNRLKMSLVAITEMMSLSSCQRLDTEFREQLWQQKKNEGRDIFNFSTLGFSHFKFPLFFLPLTGPTTFWTFQNTNPTAG